ncbi:hypothetical protein Tco_0962594 [Tanacetum coccineum]
MVPPNNLGPDLNDKAVNETQYRDIRQIPTSSGATSEEGSHPQLNSGTNPSVLVDKTKSARDGLKTAHTTSGANKESRANDIAQQSSSAFKKKHIDIRYHFSRDHILKGDIELHFILSQYQLDDIFTKPLDEPTFKRLIVELGNGLTDKSPEECSILTLSSSLSLSDFESLG